LCAGRSDADGGLAAAVSSQQPIFGGHMSGGVLPTVPLHAVSAAAPDEDDDDEDDEDDAAAAAATGLQSPPAPRRAARADGSVVSAAPGESARADDDGLSHVDDDDCGGGGGGVSGDGFRSTAVYRTWCSSRRKYAVMVNTAVASDARNATLHATNDHPYR